MLWEIGERMSAQIPGAIAEQPATFNPTCLGLVDFDTAPSGSFGQPFCHEITLTSPSTIQAAQLELVIYSNPPCAKKDRLCLTTSWGKEWCTLLDARGGHICLDLDELGLLDATMNTLLIRVAFHSMVDYIRLQTIMCSSPIVPVTPTGSSLHFKFETVLAGTGSPFVATPVAATYQVGGPLGTSVVFPSGTANMLQLANDPAQQGGNAFSMAVMIYYDEPGNPA